MAVYHVSLKRFAEARSWLAPADARVSESTDPGAEDWPAAKRKPKRRTSGTAAAKSGGKKPGRKTAAATQPLIADASLVGAVEELLRLPREQVGVLLTSCNEPTRRLMLALIYRLASLEEELRGLSSKVRSAGVQALQPATLRPVTHDKASDGKDGLLEQVFQKNVSLRQGP